MNWVVRRVKILFDSRLTKAKLHQIDKRVIAALGEVKYSPKQLALTRKLIELLETM